MEHCEYCDQVIDSDCERCESDDGSVFCGADCLLEYEDASRAGEADAIERGEIEPPRPIHSGARFDDFHELTARRDSVGCVNGADHQVKKGDRIGWSRKYRVACCASCWTNWSAENAEADAIEAGWIRSPW